MSAIVLARHPVPSSYVPKGCRVEWNLFRRHRTPVRLREIGAGEAVRLDQQVNLDMDRVWEEPRLHACAWHEGRVYADIGNTYRSGEIAPFDRQAFVRWLETDSDGRDDASGGMAILLGTALMGNEPGGRDPRGIDLDPAGIRREGYCDRERASRDLVRFMDERILLIGGVPHLRLPGPLWSIRSTYPWSEPTHGTLMPRRGHLTAVHDRLGRCCEAIGIPVPPDAAEPYSMTHDCGVPVDYLAGSLADEDLLGFANTAPFRYLQMVGSAVYRWKEPDESLMEPIRALRRWEALGNVGGIGIDEVATVTLDLLAAAAVMPAFFPKIAALPYLRQIVTYAEGYVLPLVEPAHAMDEGDLSALEGLSMPEPASP